MRSRCVERLDDFIRRIESVQLIAFNSIRTGYDRRRYTDGFVSGSPAVASGCELTLLFRNFSQGTMEVGSRIALTLPSST